MTIGRRSLDFAAGRGDDDEHRLQMAPLIDIVFLLICFYLFVAQLMSNQKDRTVQLPAMAAAEATREAPAELTINLRADGAVTMGGRTVTLDAVAATLQDQLSRSKEAGRRLRVVVRADERQRFGKLDEVLKVCRRCGAEQVVFRARREGS